MEKDEPRALREIRYEEAAQEYLRNLPPEHFMEARAQATQRKITLSSLDLVEAARPEIHVFNEMLVQYRRKGDRKPGQVVPDNMVVIHEGPIHAERHYDIPSQPALPFLVMEYVSKGTKRKDYEDNMHKYERELKVPHYLLFYPDADELTLYRHNGRKYSSVKPNAQGRYPIPELELETALHEGWVRFWFCGKLLRLPADLQRALDETCRQLAEAEQEIERLRAEVAQLKRRRNHK